MLSDQAEVRQPKFNTLAEKRIVHLSQVAMSESSSLTSLEGGLLLNQHVYLALQHRAPVAVCAGPGRAKCGRVRQGNVVVGEPGCWKAACS